MLRKFVIFSFSLLATLKIVGISEVFAGSNQEYEVKAVFLFNFTNFIRWPENVLSSTSTIKLCLVGEDSFEGTLDSVVSNERNTKHPVIVQKTSFPRDDLSSCHILFVSRSEQDNYSKIFASLAQKPVLTVGETDDFLEQGGMIEFYLQERRVRLSIALPKLRSAQLNANANLLKVAKVIE